MSREERWRQQSARKPGAPGAWLQAYRKAGLRPKQNDETARVLSGSVGGVEARVERERKVGGWSWQITAYEPRVAQKLQLHARRSWSLADRFKGHSLGDEAFDRQVIVEGDKAFALAALWRLRPWVQDWVKDGGSLEGGVFSRKLSASATSKAPLAAVVQLAAVARRMGAINKDRPLALIQGLRYEEDVAVRTRLLEAALREVPLLRPELQRVIADVASTTPAAAQVLLDLLGSEDCPPLSEGALLAALPQAKSEQRVAVIERLAEVGGEASLAALAAIASAFFEWPSVKEAAKRAAGLIEARGSGWVSMSAAGGEVAIAEPPPAPAYKG